MDCRLPHGVGYKQLQHHDALEELGGLAAN